MIWRGVRRVFACVAELLVGVRLCSRSIFQLMSRAVNLRKCACGGVPYICLVDDRLDVFGRDVLPHVSEQRDDLSVVFPYSPRSPPLFRTASTPFIVALFPIIYFSGKCAIQLKWAAGLAAELRNGMIADVNSKGCRRVWYTCGRRLPMQQGRNGEMKYGTV